MRRRWVQLAAGAVVVALGIATLRWWAAECVFAPRLASDDPRTVITAYFDAQRWGLDRAAERIESSEMRAYREAPTTYRPSSTTSFSPATW